MAYCGPRGIPLSVFLGRVAAPDESEWLPEDREAALSWSAFEGRRCKHCGTHPDEWDDDKLAYHAHLTECRGCRQLQRLSNTDDAKKGEGRFAVMSGGSAAHCPQCMPSRGM
jgi:hypothetical protein